MSASLSLLDALATVPDPRKPRGTRHPLPAILGLAVLAMLTGCKTYAAIAQFGRERGKHLAFLLGFRRARTPAVSTFCEVFRAIDPAAFEAALTRWAAARLPDEPGLQLCLDGKVARGSRDGELPAQHVLAAYAPACQTVLGQLRVAATTNEHTAALDLLGVLPLAGRVVTGDAIFCQKDVCAAIVERGGDSVLTAKDNQPGLVADIRANLAWQEHARQTAGLFSPRRTAAAGAAGG